jgi:hypothetical protein
MILFGLIYITAVTVDYLMSNKEDRKKKTY